MKKSSSLFLSLISVLFIVSFLTITESFAQSEERITISTYYPSPYGSYQELSVARDIQLGETKEDYAGIYTDLKTRYGEQEYGGARLYFSGAKSMSAGASNINTDAIWLSRYNLANDRSELRLLIGDNTENISHPDWGWSDQDYFSIGALDTTTWAPSIVFDRALQVSSRGLVGIGAEVGSDTVNFLSCDPSTTECAHTKVYIFHNERMVQKDYGLHVRAQNFASNSLHGNNDAKGAVGVWSEANGSIGYGKNYGVMAEASSGTSAYGVYGYASNGSNNYGVYGKVPDGSNNYAGYFDGNLKVKEGKNLCLGGTNSTSDPEMCKDHWGTPRMLIAAFYCHGGGCDHNDPPEYEYDTELGAVDTGIYTVKVEDDSIWTTGCWGTGGNLDYVYLVCPSGYHAESGGVLCWNEDIVANAPVVGNAMKCGSQSDWESNIGEYPNSRRMWIVSCGSNISDINYASVRCLRD